MQVGRRLALGQPRKCRQAHDAETYRTSPRMGRAWRTFWVPFSTGHGDRPYLGGADDGGGHVQIRGEYMVWTDGEHTSV